MSRAPHEDAMREAYVRQRMKEAHRAFADAGMVMLFLTSFALFFMDMLFAQPQNLVILHFARFATMLGCLEYYRSGGGPGSRGVFVAQLVYFGAGGVGALMLGRAVAAGGDGVVPANYFLVTCLFYVIAAPLPVGRTALVAAVFSGMGLAACWPALGSWYQFSAVQTLTLAFGVVLHAAMEWTTAAAARREIDTRLRIAPIDLVRRAQGQDVHGESFKLGRERRQCICLASDWRGYQALSREVPAETLQLVLGAYYDMCRALLEERFPDGQYFCDWIADELLILFLVPDGATAEVRAASVLSYARELLRRKAAFTALHGVPRAIDIGLATGSATVGLFGPVTNRKVMAIGRVAVDARKLQSRGKQLRKAEGDRDRIVYGDDLHELAGRPRASRELSAGMSVHVAAPAMRVVYEESTAEVLLPRSA